MIYFKPFIRMILELVLIVKHYFELFQRGVIWRLMNVSKSFAKSAV